MIRVKTTRWPGLGVVPLLMTVASLTAAGGDHRLADAVKQQDKAAVRALLDQDLNVNAAQGDGATALHWAAHWDDLDTADQLIRAGADVNASNDLGVTPLSLACTNGNAAMVETLLKAGANANAAQPIRETALMTAAWTGNLEVVKLLLAHGANVNAKEASRAQTALMWAASEQHPAIVRLLVEHGADVHARSKESDGFTPLLFAARVNDLDSVRILLSAGANVNETAGEKVGGSNALLVATVRGHMALAAFLLDQGADPNNAGAGFTPLHWAAGSWETSLTGAGGIVTEGTQEWAALVGLPTGKLDLIEALLAHGANPNARLERPPIHGGLSRARLTDNAGGLSEGVVLAGATPFLLAAMAADVSVMRVFSAAGADPRLATKEGTTPLMVAVGKGRIPGETFVTESQALEAARLALELGNAVNAADDSGDTALHAAALIKSNTLVQFLVDNGATVNVENKRGETPLMYAERILVALGKTRIERTSTGDLLRELGAT